MIEYVNLSLHYSYGYRVVLPFNGKLAAERCQNYAAQPQEVDVYLPFLPSSP